MSRRDDVWEDVSVSHGISSQCTVSKHLRAFSLDIRGDFPSDALFQSISVHFRTIWKIHIEEILENTYRGFFSEYDWGGVSRV